MKNQRYRILVAACIAVLISSCNSIGKDDNAIVIDGYNPGKPEKFSMPESLLEVSGITFYKGNPDTVYAIQDEEGKLFRLAWKVKKQYHAKFAKKGDYEDVGIINDKVIILKSNGTLYSFSFPDAIYEEIDQVQEWKDLLPEGEYEGMYADEASGKIYIICKNCGGKKSGDKLPGYIIQPDEPFSLAGSFEVDIKSIQSITGKVKNGFRPSALAKNPVTNEWFIVSAVNKLLVIADSNWNIKTTAYLSSNTFNQPEGIAFDTAGNLYISNEGDDLSDGNILKFRRTR